MNYRIGETYFLEELKQIFSHKWQWEKQEPKNGFDKAKFKRKG